MLGSSRGASRGRLLRHLHEGGLELPLVDGGELVADAGDGAQQPLVPLGLTLGPRLKVRHLVWGGWGGGVRGGLNRNTRVSISHARNMRKEREEKTEKKPMRADSRLVSPPTTQLTPLPPPVPPFPACPPSTAAELTSALARLERARKDVETEAACRSRVDTPSVGLALATSSIVTRSAYACPSVLVVFFVVALAVIWCEVIFSGV